MGTEWRVLRLAAFAENGAGGNPAGVLIADRLPDPEEMRRIAAEVGYSETAFAARTGEDWRVRYFSPVSEVPFCGHATIALGAALALGEGSGRFSLRLNATRISVEAWYEGEVAHAALLSPPTRSGPPRPGLVEEVLALFGLGAEELDPALPPALIHGGADHLLLALRSREALAEMRYDFEAGRALMLREGWITIALVRAETARRFHARNVGASIGVYEDPATGAAAAAFAGYLRGLGWPHGGAIEIIQGEDMGMRSRLLAEIPPEAGSAIRLSGEVRRLE